MAPVLLASSAAPERRPAQELAGRTAAAPEHCVPMREASALRVSDSDPHMLLYGSGKTIWANDLGHCSLRRGDVLISEPLGSHYCRGDVIRSVDSVTRTIPGPVCVLGDFVPYTR
jgi:hypothetical protein